MNEVTLMLVGAVGDDPPTILLERNGSWHPTSEPSSTFALSSIRARFASALETAVKRKRPEDPLALLGIASRALTNDLIPPEVGQALADARKASDSPVLRIHTPPTLEWIPWEVMWDGSDYIGLTFEVARAPIVKQPPGTQPTSPRAVSRVSSLLGRAVADPPAAERFKSWLSTFDAVPPGPRIERNPTANTSTTWPTLIDLDADVEILHLTCHGERHAEWGLSWTLNPSDDDEARHIYVLDQHSARGLGSGFTAARPFVFGNACAPDITKAGELTPDVPQLATSLIEGGAHNVVSSVATIGLDLAIEFAQAFYAHLLREGRPVADALRATKLDFHRDRDPQGDPSYLLYCLYGPPDTKYEPVRVAPPQTAAAAAP